MKEINQITKAELKALKAEYDSNFLRYWQKPDGTTRHSIISMDEFKHRFFKIPFTDINKHKKLKSWYCDTCGGPCPQTNVIAGFGFCENCI